MAPLLSTVATLTIGAVTAPAAVTVSGTYAADLGTGASSDRLTIIGSLNLTGTSALTLSGTASGSPYTLATYAGLAGTFATVNNLPPNYMLVYGPTALQLVPIPEPATILALCCAGAGIAGWTRHLRRRGGTP